MDYLPGCRQEGHAGVRLNGKIHWLGYHANPQETGRIAAAWRAEHMSHAVETIRGWGDEIPGILPMNRRSHQKGALSAKP